MEGFFCGSCIWSVSFDLALALTDEILKKCQGKLKRKRKLSLVCDDE